ncbi:MAG: adenylate/guanylate cyclase domain-containing protein [Alphaproteobacteria bacterium]
MAADNTHSPMFDQLGVWILEQGISEAPVEKIISGFGRGLVAGGIALHRISLGGMLLHPVFGALDVVWDAQDDTVTSKMVPREIMTTEESQNSPFFWALTKKSSFQRIRLDSGPTEPRFPLLDRLQDEGVTDYLLFFESYGRKDSQVCSDLPTGTEGVLLSLATHRIGGFSEFEINYLRALMRPLSLCIKASTTYQLARALLDTYLGQYSGNRILNGVMSRGDGGMIDCVLFYCNLRGSTKLAEELPLADYLALINSYFDCTAGAVSDHGGEVLKFIGDAVLAIFPIDGDGRSAVDMCRAAINATREAFERAEKTNGGGDNGSGPNIEFGISLHRGQGDVRQCGHGPPVGFHCDRPGGEPGDQAGGVVQGLGCPSRHVRDIPAALRW